MSTEEVRIGDWMPTFTGRHFWVLDPRAEDVVIEDIAHQLAIINRYGGTSRVPVSVAQHSVLVSRLCEKLEPANRDSWLWGLLHDAGEAYLGIDVPRPVKRLFPEIDAAEKRILQVVVERFGLTWPAPEVVKIADEIALATEARDFVSQRNDIRTWEIPQEPLPEVLRWTGWQWAESEFLTRFHRLSKDRQ